MRKITILFITIISFFSNALSQTHWESIILASDTWSYLPAISAPAAGWYLSEFNDKSWATGIGGFGYGDNDDATTISKSNSVYLRKKITISDITKIEKIILDIDYDDAFVMYVNGAEVARSSNIAANPPLFNSLVSSDREALLYQNLSPERHFLKTNNFKQGENTVAVQVLNYNQSSSDMSAAVFLNAKINNPTTIYKVVPSWFEAPIDDVESTLPLIIIDTQGQTIGDISKITATMKVINNKNHLNNVNDTTYEYNGNIGIKIRGTTSQNFEKKSYNVETRDELGNNLNVELLGLPTENDWVFHGPYTDKSLMRNALAYHLGNLTGRWSPRTRFCEMYINNEYRGVSVLVEKLKIDKNRLDLAKLKPLDNDSDQLTGGYLLKIDRPDEGYWISPYKARNDIQNVPISYVDPEYVNLTIEQRNYIRNYVTNFENALRGTNYQDSTLGYRPYINYESFVDYYILNEISRNLDGYRVSTYFYKDKDSKGGKLTMGPFWDYNLTFGNANFFSAGNTSGWIVDGLGNGDQYGIPFWWDKFRLDPYFNAQLKSRWNKLRADKYSNENINSYIDSCATVLSAGAQQRNFNKFKILNTYVWPNNYIGGTYANEVNYMKTWIGNRLSWMDTQIRAISITEDRILKYTNSVEILTYPNPFTEYITFSVKLPTPAKVNIVIQDLLGKTICTKTQNFDEGIKEIYFDAKQFNNGTNLYIYKMSINNEMVHSGKIMKQ